MRKWTLKFMSKPQILFHHRALIKADEKCLKFVHEERPWRKKHLLNGHLLNGHLPNRHLPKTNPKLTFGFPLVFFEMSHLFWKKKWSAGVQSKIWNLSNFWAKFFKFLGVFFFICPCCMSVIEDLNYEHLLGPWHIVQFGL